MAADLIYLLLKRAEWFAVLALRCFVPNFDKLANRLYSSPPDGAYGPDKLRHRCES